jgi:hypothetical protein
LTLIIDHSIFVVGLYHERLHAGFCSQLVG